MNAKDEDTTIYHGHEPTGWNHFKDVAERLKRRINTRHATPALEDLDQLWRYLLMQMKPDDNATEEVLVYSGDIHHVITPSKPRKPRNRK